MPTSVTTHNSKERSRMVDCCIEIELDPSSRWRDPRDRGWGQLGFPAAKWEMKARLMSKTMSIELEGEPLKTNLLRLHQILSQAMVGKREKA